MSSTLQQSRNTRDGWGSLANPFYLIQDDEKSGSARVTVALTYRESPDTYGKPPDPKHSRSWQVVVLVKSEAGHPVVDDVIQIDSPNWRLSEAFKGCRGSEWVGSTP